jgi:hypothetical protein
MYAIQLDESHESSRSRPALVSWSYLRIAVAALLLIAVVAKVQDITRILAGEGLLSSKPLLLTAIGIESALAVYLLIGDRRWSWRLTIALFSIFTVISGYAWVTGQDCNCIDRRIGSGWMLLMDIAVLAAAFWRRPRDESAIDPEVRATMSANPLDWQRAHSKESMIERSPNRTSLRPIIPLAIAATVGIATATAANWQHQTNITSASSDQIEYLLPELLIGKRWPIDSRYHPELKALETGNWMVVIVRRDCDHCKEFLAKNFADPTWHRPGERTVCFSIEENRWFF